MIKNATYMNNGLPYLSCPYNRNFHTNTYTEETTWQTLTNKTNHWIVLRASQEHAKPTHTVTLYQPETYTQKACWTIKTYQDIETGGYTLEETTTQHILDTYFSTGETETKNLTYLMSLLHTGYTDVGWEKDITEALEEKHGAPNTYRTTQTRLQRTTNHHFNNIANAIYTN